MCAQAVLVELIFWYGSAVALRFLMLAESALNAWYCSVCKKWQDWPVIGSGPLPGFRVVLLTEGGLRVII